MIFSYPVLPLHSSGRKSGSQILFNPDEQDNDRDVGEQGCGKQVLPFHHVITIEDIDTDRERLDNII